MATIFLESKETDPAYNLALEQYVFDFLPRDQEYFMLWQNDNAIIVGKHQNTAEEINAKYVEENGIRVVRRLSGGGAVYHDMGNINFTFIVDAKNIESLNLHSFCEPVVKALAKIGVTAEVTGRNDITIDGQKFSGNAQYIKQKRIMHHGTIMFDSNLPVVAAALNVSKDKIESKGVKSVRSRVTNVKPHVKGEVTLQEFWEILRRYMVEDQDMQSYHLTEEDERAVQKLREERYATWDWNFGYSPDFSIQKERRIEGVGKIQVFMEVEKGYIKAYATYGDYFGTGEASELAEILMDCALEKTALEEALKDVDISYYYNNLTKEDFIDILLQ